MGYRSDVAICFGPEVYQQWKETLEKAEKENKNYSQIVELFATSASREQHDPSGAVVWTWENIKWCCDAPEIDFVETFMRQLSWSDYLYIRVGELFDDLEICGNLWENPFGLQLVRGSVCNL